MTYLFRLFIFLIKEIRFAQKKNLNKKNIQKSIELNLDEAIFFSQIIGSQFLLEHRQT